MILIHITPETFQPKDPEILKGLKVQLTTVNSSDGILLGKVKSSNLDIFYDVMLMFKSSMASCSCQDFMHRGKVCKHIQAFSVVAFHTVFNGLAPEQIQLHPKG